ncbi:MAG: glutaredoxin family protein [Halobacteria archaeon]|nr:glutaredoxin family protein [Halobacteria archaeon]
MIDSEDSEDGTDIELLVRDDCPHCEEAKETVEAVVGSDYETVNVDEKPALRELYGDEVPVVMVDGVAEFRVFVDEDELREVLGKG